MLYLKYLILIIFYFNKVSAFAETAGNSNLIFCIDSQIDVSLVNRKNRTFIQGKIFNLNTGSFIENNEWRKCKLLNKDCGETSLIIKENKLQNALKSKEIFNLNLEICDSKFNKENFTFRCENKFNLVNQSCVNFNSQAGNAGLLVLNLFESCANISLTPENCKNCGNLQKSTKSCGTAGQILNLVSEDCEDSGCEKRAAANVAREKACRDGTVWNACSGFCEVPNTANLRTKCDYGEVPCLERNGCAGQPTGITGKSQPCGNGKVLCMDAEGCFYPDPVFYGENPYQKPCRRGYTFCLKSGICIPRPHDPEDDGDFHSDFVLECTLVLDKKIFKTTTCQNHTDCFPHSRCCPDSTDHRQCVSLNGTVSPSVSDSACPSSQIYPRQKTTSRCKSQRDCPFPSDACCNAFCYSMRNTCPEGLIFCDVVAKCIDILNENCGKSCAPPSVYCRSTGLCTSVTNCSGQYNGGKPWSVFPLTNTAMLDGFALEQIWRTLNSSATYFMDLYANETLGCGMWEIFSQDRNEWVPLKAKNAFRGQNLIRVLPKKNESRCLASLKLHDGIVERKLVHYFQIPTKIVAVPESPKVYIISTIEDSSQLINATSLISLDEVPVDANQLESLGDMLEMNSQDVDTTSNVFKNLWKFYLEKKRVAGWTVEFRQKPKKLSEVMANLEYSMDEGRSWIRIDPTKAIGFTDAHVLLKLAAKKDKTGSVELTFSTSEDQDSGKSRNILNVILTVAPQNDPPSPRTQLDFDNFPVLNSASNDSGFTAKSLANKFYTDIDGDNLGLLIFSSANETHGKWQFKKSDSYWTDVYIPNSFIFKTSSSFGHFTNQLENTSLIPALVLNPNDRLRFSAIDKSIIESPAIVFTAWDQSSEELGSFVKIPGPAISFSPVFSAFKMEAAGCSGIRGIFDYVDKCGICGGDGSSCTVCNRTAGKPKFECGLCSSDPVIRDCAFQCREINTKTPGENICIIKNRSLTYCDGTKGSFVNKCGFCVAGKTGLEPNYGTDSCGICFGKNLTCKGCDSLLNSGKTIDSCGKCLHRNDPSRNRCIAFGRFDPATIDLVYGTRHNITIETFGIAETILNLSCQFISKDPMNGRAVIRKSAIRLDRLVIFAEIYGMGQYSVVCSWRMNGQQFTRKSDDENFLRAIDSRIVTLSSIVPSKVSAGTLTNVTLTASDFNEAKIFYCVYRLNKQTVRKLRVLQVSSTNVLCETEVFYSPGIVQFSLLLSEFDPSRIGKTFDLLPHLDIQVSAPSLVVLNASLNPTYDILTVAFNRNVEGPEKCTEIFRSNSLQKIGSNSNCFFQANKLIVQLDSIHEIAPGTILSFRLPNPVHVYGSPENMETELLNKSVTVLAAENIQQVADFSILGFGVVCPNKTFTYETDLPEFFTKNSKFSWNLSAADGRNATSVGKNQTLNSKFIGIFSSLNTTYNLRLELNTSLAGKNLQTFRQRLIKTNNYFSLKLQGPREIHQKRSYVVQAEVGFCGSKNATRKLKFDWSINSTASATKINSPKFKIPNYLTPGKYYEIKCRVSFLNETNIFVEDTWIVHVRDQGLEAKIAISAQNVGSEKIVLDSAGSSGPSKDLQYIWRCQQQSKTGCYVSGTTKRLEEYLGLQNLTKPILEIPSGILSPGYYTFTVAVYSGLLPFSEASANVTVQPGDLPPLWIHSPTNEKTIPAGFACNRPCRAYWTAVEETGVNTELYNSFYYRETTADAGATKNFPLKLGDVRLEPGPLDKKLKFRLNVEYLDSVTSKSTADVYLTVNSPPFGGNFSVFPSEVEALVDIVTFSAARWQDQREDFPLIFEFGFYGNDEEDIVWIDCSISESITTFLPAIEEQNFIIPVLRICDSRSACSLAYGELITTHRTAVYNRSTIDKTIDYMNSLVDELKFSQAIYVGYALTTTYNVSHVAQSVENAILNVMEYYIYEWFIDNREAIDILKKITDLSGKMGLSQNIFKKLKIVQNRISKPNNRLSSYRFEETANRFTVSDINYLLKTTEISLNSGIPGQTSAVALLKTLHDNLKSICDFESISVKGQSSTIGFSSRIDRYSQNAYHLIPTSFLINHSYIQIDNRYSSIDTCLTTIEVSEDYFMKLNDYFNVPRCPRRSNIVATFVDTDTTLSIYVSDATARIDTRLECLTWTDHYWSNASCQTLESIIGKNYIDCKCNTSGHHAVFALPIPIRYTTTPVSKSGMIRINEDFNQKIGNRKSEFVDKVRSQLCSILSIPPESFTYMDAVPGSIIIKFQLSNLINNQSIDIDTPYQQLSNLLSNGSLRLYDLNGTLLSIPAQTLNGQTGSTTDQGIDTSIVVGVALAAACVILFVAVILCVVYKNKKKESKIEPAAAIPSHYPALYRNLPYDNYMEGSGVVRQRYPNDTNLQWALFEHSFGKNNNPWESQLKAWNNLDSKNSVPDPAKYKEPTDQLKKLKQK